MFTVKSEIIEKQYCQRMSTRKDMCFFTSFTNKMLTSTFSFTSKENIFSFEVIVCLSANKYCIFQRSKELLQKLTKAQSPLPLLPFTYLIDTICLHLLSPTSQSYKKKNFVFKRSNKS